MHNLFTYGSLREPTVQQKVIGRTIPLDNPDTLLGYKTSTVKLYSKIYPILVVDKNGKIEGYVLSVNDRELKNVDAYETSAYRRIKVSLKSGTTAWVYVK